MKHAAPDAWIATARRVVEVCRRHRARCVVNDSVEVALAAGADGVHLGSQDLDWREARARLGAGRILGGTVNSLEDAARAVSVRVLDYVGVGPWRFTTTKKKLSPVLGPAGVRTVISALDGLPAWVIGGITQADLPEVCAAGAAGVAVSSALLNGGLDHVEGAFRAFAAAWPHLRESRSLHPVSHL
jgi:thiamine-phosphate pyrophosphorylase